MANKCYLAGGWRFEVIEDGTLPIEGIAFGPGHVHIHLPKREWTGRIIVERSTDDGATWSEDKNAPIKWADGFSSGRYLNVLRQPAVVFPLVYSARVRLRFEGVVEPLAVAMELRQ